MTLEELRHELESRRSVARSMGSPTKLAELRADKRLNARERLAALIDPGTFLEQGLLATAPNRPPGTHAPADGKITGIGDVDGRPVAVVANDFTVLGASSSPVNTKKVRRLKHLAAKRRIPMVFLGESSGGRMPDVMGASNVAAGDDPTQYQRIRHSPWVSAVLGSSYGSSSWYASMSDFVVMRKGATLGVASPRLASVAIGEDVDPEELGGWRVHTTVSGLVDVAVNTDEEAIQLMRRFLSYLPSHADTAPPVSAVPEDADDPARADRLLGLLPETLNRGYDMRKVLDCIVDPGSQFPLKPDFGKSIVTSLARIDGHSVGIVASNPMFTGGAITPDACSKVSSFLVLCDSFNVPLVFIADQPGFLIGRDGERKGATGRVMNWMNALSLCTVPKIAIVARKSYGQGVLNMGLGGNADHACAWTTAEISFMNPTFGAQVLLGERASDPALLEEQVEEISRGTSPFDAAATFAIDDVIDPPETRDYLRRVLSLHRGAPIGKHLMQAWPTTL